jgi:hypothetical protein
MSTKTVKTVVTVDVPETATEAEFLTALWNDDDNDVTFLDENVTDDDMPDSDSFVADDGLPYYTATGKRDYRVSLDSLTFSTLAVDRWANEGRRIPKAVALPLLATLADAATDKDDVSTLQYMSMGEPVSKRAARQALRSFTPEIPFGPITEDWQPAYSPVGLTTLAALIAWSKVNDK